MTRGPHPASDGINDDAIEERIAQRVVELLRPELDEILRSAGFARALSLAAWQETTGESGTSGISRDVPRPPEIDRACKLATERGKSQRVHLASHGMTFYVQPSSDPQEIWLGMIAKITGEDRSEVRRLPRASGD